MRGKRHLVNMFRSLPLAGRRYLVSVVVRSVVVWSVVVWSVVGPLPILIIVTKLVADSTASRDMTFGENQMPTIRYSCLLCLVALAVGFSFAWACEDEHPDVVKTPRQSFALRDEAAGEVLQLTFDPRGLSGLVFADGAEANPMLTNNRGCVRTTATSGTIANGNGGRVIRGEIVAGLGTGPRLPFSSIRITPGR